MSKTKTLNRRRYRPVSEFDEATLACKREYWRTRKREQRARLSQSPKKLSKSPNTGIFKQTFAVSTQRTPRSQFSSILLNSDGSYQTDVRPNLTNSYFTPQIKSDPELNQKETLCEDTACNQIVNPTTSNNDFEKCSVVQNEDVKCLTTEESNIAASVVKLNGVPFTNYFPMSTPSAEVQTNITETQQSQNRFSAFTSNLLNIPQKSNVSRITPENNNQKHPQIKNCLQARTAAFIESKADGNQRITGGRGRSRRACARVPERRKAQDRSTDVSMTEEEKAAKRRENWRIKKREQRAKRAEKLRKDTERTQGQEEVGKLSCVVPTHTLSSVNTMAKRGAKQPNSEKSADLILCNGKPVHFPVKVEGDILSPPLKQSPHKHHSARKDGAQGSVARNLLSVNNTNHLQVSKPNRLSACSGVSLRYSIVNRAATLSKNHSQKMVQTQKRQNLTQRLPQRDDRVETAEERHAKQREYWRIRKRLQRARLSVELKARKERDALKGCAGYSQTNRDQVRKIQTGVRRVQHPNKNKSSSAYGTSIGFIGDNTTVSDGISKHSAEMLPQATSCSLHVVRSSSPTNPSTSQKVVCVRSSPAKRGTPNRFNSSVNIHQRSNSRSVVPVLVSKLANSTTEADVLRGSTEAGIGDELNREAKSGRSLDLVPHNTMKQERGYPSIECVYSLAEESHSEDIKDTSPPPSPPSETKAEKEASVSDSQATTLLAVASMKKLLEESLSTVVDSNICQDGPLPCKTEDKLSPQENEPDINPDLATHHGAEECSFSGDDNLPIEVKQSTLVSHSPLENPGFSLEDAVLSCQGSSLQFPLTNATESSCLVQIPEDRPQALSVARRVRPIQRRPRKGPKQCFSEVRGQQSNERSELQKKREYWRVMKRRQRARKAKEMERYKYAVQHKQLFQNKCISSQVCHPSVGKAASYTNLNSHAGRADVPLRPTRLVLSPTASNQQSSNRGKTKISQMKKWHQKSAPTSSSRPDTVTSIRTSHVKPSSPHTRTRRSFMTGLKKSQSQLKAATNQGLDAEEILRRKRMHWRIKKQEQRAKKAARERELCNQTNLSHLEFNPSDNNAELVQSSPPHIPDYLPKQCQITSLKDEAELCFLPGDECSDEPLSEARWRNIYLMDYDPTNQLLVCMVCGEQQYCLSVEGVKAHIEEAHPATLSLEEMERQDILQAWDEQVAVRERFFTNQLWQQSDSFKCKEESVTHTAEVEVVLDADDMKQTTKCINK